RASTRSTSVPGGASKTSMTCSFPHAEGPSTEPLSPRRNQIPERRIFEAQPPDTDALEAELVHQRQFSTQRFGALNPELVMHPIGVVTEVHLILDWIKNGGRPMLLGQHHGIGVGARRQVADARPVVIVAWQAEGCLLRGHALHRELERLAHPRRSSDSAGPGDTVVLVVGHEGQKVSRLRQGGE